MQASPASSASYEKDNNNSSATATGPYEAPALLIAAAAMKTVAGRTMPGTEEQFNAVCFARASASKSPVHTRLE